MKKLDKQNKIRFFVAIIFILITVIATIFLIPVIKSFLTENGRKILENRVQSFGAFGWLIFIIIQIIQVIVAFIPGEPIEIVGGVLFGTISGMLLCLLGLLIGTIIVYYLVKLVGKPLVFALVSEEKFNKLKFLNNKKKLETVIFILYLIPGVPKDALNYIIPLTEINPMTFFLISTLSRIPSVISSTLVGSSLGNGHFALSIIILLLTAIIGLIGILFNERIINFFKQWRNKY